MRFFPANAQGTMHRSSGGKNAPQDDNKKGGPEPPLKIPNHAYSIFTLSTWIESPLTAPVAAM